MSLRSNLTNRDILQSTKFQFNFSRLPEVSFFCQTVNIPGLNLTEAIYPTPFIDLWVPGEKLIYDTLNLTFLVQEDIANWESIHDWIRGMTFPEDFKNYRDLKSMSHTSYSKYQSKLPPQYSDGVLTIYSNKNNPRFRVEFVDLFPTSVSGIQFSAMDSAENIITCDATFRFGYYTIKKLEF